MYKYILYILISAIFFMLFYLYQMVPTKENFNSINEDTDSEDTNDSESEDTNDSKSEDTEDSESEDTEDIKDSESEKTNDSDSEDTNKNKIKAEKSTESVVKKATTPKTKTQAEKSAERAAKRVAVETAKKLLLKMGSGPFGWVSLIITEILKNVLNLDPESFVDCPKGWYQADKLPKEVKKVISVIPFINDIFSLVGNKLCIKLDCTDDKFKQDGLCYKKCRQNYKNVGPVCWKQCGKDKDIGALCRERCRDGYDEKAGVCYKKCDSGYKDLGLTCVKR